MRKTVLTLTLILVVAFIGTAFAMEVPANETPTIAVGTPAPSESDTVASETIATIPDTRDEEVKKEEVYQNPTQAVISEEAANLSDMKNLLFFDTEKDNVMSYAASISNCVVKPVQGVVTFVDTHELQVNVPELNNDFCFNCVEPYTEQLGDTVTIWLVIMVQN
jgi:hypothetical protein